MKHWFMAGSHPNDYEQGSDSAVTYHGKNSGYLKASVAQPEGFGTLMQMFKADQYRNKRMRFSAAVKSDGVESWAGLWMRIDGPESESLGFDNMQNRPIRGTRRLAGIRDYPAGAAAKCPYRLRHSLVGQGAGLAQRCAFRGGNG